MLSRSNASRLPAGVTSSPAAPPRPPDHVACRMVFLLARTRPRRPTFASPRRRRPYARGFAAPLALCIVFSASCHKHPRPKPAANHDVTTAPEKPKPVADRPNGFTAADAIDPATLNAAPPPRRSISPAGAARISAAFKAVAGPGKVRIDYVKDPEVTDFIKSFVDSITGAGWTVTFRNYPSFFFDGPEVDVSCRDPDPPPEVQELVKVFREAGIVAKTNTLKFEEIAGNSITITIDSRSSNNSWKR